ncbi:MAG: hypothetical protein Kow0059_18440 [Candidatus Sumerlaeia bacterium]
MTRQMNIANGLLCAVLALGLAAWVTPPARADEPAPPEQPPKHISIQSGGLKLTYHIEHGATLRVFGVPFIRGTSLWVMTPGWAQRIYGPIDRPDLIQQARIEDLPDGGRRLTLEHRPPDDKPQTFHGTETFTLAPGNLYSHTLAYTYTGESDAVIEWTVARLNVTPLIGRRYRVTGGDGAGEGVVPLRAASPDIHKSMLASEFTAFAVDSRLGPVTITAGGPNDLWLFDYRLNRWADAADPYFWYGRYERPVEKNKPYEMTITMDFPDTPRASDARPAPIPDISVVPTQSALAPNLDPVSIVPVPQEQTFTGQDMPIGPELSLLVIGAPTPELKNAADFFTGDMKARFDIEIPVVWNAPPPPDDALPAGAIVIGKTSEWPVGPDGPAPPTGRKEGYSLQVNGRQALVRAETDTGLYYGLLSLLQLVKVSETGLSFKGAQVRDWPALDFRGIHCLSAKNGGDEIAKAVRTLMARHKINTLVWQCDYIIWDHAPELEHPEFGMTKSEARKVIEAARAANIELIPLVPSLGHSEWIFVNNHNLDIAEDTEQPYAYSPVVPRTYEFIFAIYQEALDFFQPRRFHIGHDEVTMLGRFPHRSSESGLSVTELIMFDTLKLYRWFKARGVQMMLWGDMFIHSSEASDAGLAPSLWDARVRRELLPRDVIVCDWHYQALPPERYVSLNLFKNEGFPTIACPWYRPTNIRNLTLQAVNTGCEGLLQTTWAGFNFKIDGNERNWFQYWAYLWAAQYAWNGRDIAIEDLPFDAQQTFMDLWFERRARRKPQPGFMVNLSPLLNRRLEDGPGGGWVGLGPEMDFSRFDPKTDLFGETRFFLGRGQDGERALMLAGLMNPDGRFPSLVNIPLGGARASELHLLLTAAFAAEDATQAGEVTLEFDDGSNRSVPLEYGRNLFAFTDPRCSREARIAWQGKTLNGTMVRLWDVTIPNPQPERPLKALILRSAGTEAAPILFAVTGVN